MKNRTFSAKRKDRIKIIRGFLQVIFIGLILGVIIKTLFFDGKYQAFPESARVQTDKGFVTLSYFGVDRSEGDSLIDIELLEDHLSNLKENGYVTISQQDIIDYYEKGTKLPEKSLFLVFEDGRRDTVIFAQKILEKLNYKATILTYAQNLEEDDPKFVTKKDLKELEKSTFWEMGSNGYRLAYINAFDRHENYIGELDTYEFQMMSSFLDRNYIHYLMDYTRDELGIPKEDLDDLKNRIVYDYDKMRSIYTDTIGHVPNLYILMHSNTGQFGTNDKASSINETEIKNTFTMNFNREGDSVSSLDNSIYDLTRMQPQAYWHTNHLLMRLSDDTHQAVDFLVNDDERASKWTLNKGAYEFDEASIVLTTPPSAEASATLNNGNTFKNLKLSTRLKGNQRGSQSILLRTNDDRTEYLSFEIKDNVAYIYDTSKSEEPLYSMDLNEFDGVKTESMEENRYHAEIRDLETQLRYTNSLTDVETLTQTLNEKKTQLEELDSKAGERYVPEIELSKLGNRLVDITLNDTLLSVKIDGKILVQDIVVEHVQSGSVVLSATPSVNNYSQRHLVDDVYDGVFEDLVIHDMDTDEILYDNRLKGADESLSVLKKTWNSILNWFIKAF